MGLFDLLKKLFTVPLKPAARSHYASDQPSCPIRSSQSRPPEAPYYHTRLWHRAKLLRSQSETERLSRLGLPVLHSGPELAYALGITWKQLVWLVGSWSTRDEPPAHYTVHRILKSSGGERWILAPKAHLKRVQRRILKQILNKLPPHPAACGFVEGKGLSDNVHPHVGQHVVVKLDLKDFFPTIRYARVRGVFVAMGYSTRVAHYLAMICCSQSLWELLPSNEVHKERIAKGLPNWLWRRVLPQGAPTSPAISNLVCRRLDARLTALAARFKARYTRYADDMTFSGGPDFLHQLSPFFELAGKIIRNEGFRINWEKRRVLHNGGRQIVTGIVVNHHPTLPREERQLLRAMVHQYRTTGTFELPDDVLSSDPEDWLEGRLSWYRQVDPVRGGKLWEEFRHVGR